METPVHMNQPSREQLGNVSSNVYNEYNESKHIHIYDLPLYMSEQLEKNNIKFDGEFEKIIKFCSSRNKEDIDREISRIVELRKKFDKTRTEEFGYDEKSTIFMELKTIQSIVGKLNPEYYNSYIADIDSSGKTPFNKDIDKLSKMFGKIVNNDKILELNEKIVKAKEEINHFKGSYEELRRKKVALEENVSYLETLKKNYSREKSLLTRDELKNARELFDSMRKSLDYDGTFDITVYPDEINKIRLCFRDINKGFERYFNLIEEYEKSEREYNEAYEKLINSINNSTMAKKKDKDKEKLGDNGEVSNAGMNPEPNNLENNNAETNNPEPNNLGNNNAEINYEKFIPGQYIVFNGNIPEANKDDYEGLEKNKRYKVVSDDGEFLVTIKTDKGDKTLSKTSFDSLEKFYKIDVKESDDIKKIVLAISLLNPGVAIRLGNPDIDPQANERFYSSEPVEKLILPSGFYYNEKNGVTNKHIIQSGNYISLQVESLDIDHIDELINPLVYARENPELKHRIVENNPEEKVVFTGYIPKVKPFIPISDYANLKIGKEYIIKNKSSKDEFYQLKELEGKHFHHSSFVTLEKWNSMSKEEQEKYKNNKPQKVTNSTRKTGLAVSMAAAGIAGICTVLRVNDKIPFIARGSLEYAEDKFKRIGFKEAYEKTKNYLANLPKTVEEQVMAGFEETNSVTMSR